MNSVPFCPGAWAQQMIYAYTRRYESFPVFTQEADHICSGRDEANDCGFANISLFFSQPCADGSKISTSFRFEDAAAPLIVLANELEPDAGGHLRFGNYIEVVVWKNGLNVWQMHETNGRVTWQKLCGLEYPVDGSQMQTLSVRRAGERLWITHGAQKLNLLVQGLPASLFLGIDACEGVCRFYSASLCPPAAPTASV